ncbi:hypothetical protein BDD12DRAFT_861372 [Trichophaea hybrida]|nr:hypothetical protein BDD12DRAFT_861372 [Trichophaea hybrida]
MAPIVHIVAVKLPSISVQEFQSLHDDFLALKTSCKKPDGSTYIRSIRGGLENSPEVAKLNKDYTHAFIVEFECKEDRDYYITQDPMHSEYAGKLLGAVGGVEGVLVVDFEVGVY